MQSKRKRDLNLQLQKLRKNKIDAQHYIQETISWQEDILVKTGYLNKDVHGVTITLLGKTASVINESDSFLCAEYLTKLFDRTFEDSENTKTALTFV